ncbi:MAG TPA: hypothetical protein ENJ95_18070 [Bacteroidetes bacterium]|nr:hypothetical protein [Bacteroidota bacterium]
MMLKKEQVLQLLNSLPNEFEIYDLVEGLVVLQKIETGLQQVSEGKTVDTQEARKQLAKWLKK